MTPVRITIAGGIVAMIAIFLLLGMDQYLSLDYLKAQKNALQAYYQSNPFKISMLYFFSYVIMAALSLPVALIMTLTAGVIFGVLWGTTLAVIASTLGATLAFLVSRVLLHDYVQGKFGGNLAIINNGIRRDGALYLFTLRVVPVFPFFVINAVMGLTPIRTVIFAAITLIGMIPITLIVTNAGKQLAKIESVDDILSPQLIFSFALLGLFPLVAKKVIDYVKSRRA